MDIFIAVFVIGAIIAAIVNSDGSSSSPNSSQRRPTQNSQKSKQVMVKRNGQNKHYRINKYGEVFEE